MKGSLLTSGFPSRFATLFVVISLSVAFAGISVKLPVNTSLAAYSNVVKPRQGGSDWQLRFQVQFLSPR
jgi:hypothetical protein